MIRLMVLCLALVIACGQVAYAADDAPDFKLKDLDGEKVELEELLEDANLLVIDFWQVGCIPCNELLPYLQEYYDDYLEAEAGVEIVIISRDTNLTLPQVEPFFTANEYTFRVLLDSELDVSKDYGVEASPATFLITPDLELVWSHYGYKPGQEEEIKEQIDEYLAEHVK